MLHQRVIEKIAAVVERGEQAFARCRQQRERLGLASFLNALYVGVGCSEVDSKSVALVSFNVVSPFGTDYTLCQAVAVGIGERELHVVKLVGHAIIGRADALLCFHAAFSAA